MQAEATASATSRAKKAKVSATVPDYLTYEIDEGRPIDYRGYKEVIKKAKTPEEITGCSIIRIFTGSRKYLFAEPGKKWSISNWSDDLEIMPGIVLNIEKLLSEV